MRIAIAFSTLFFIAGIAATASTVLNDPEILIDSGGDPLNISTSLGVAQPCSPGPCSFDFLNDTGGIVTNFTFETTINPNLSSTAIDSFTCADPSGFFLNCSIHYDPSGDLKYLFTGVLASDNDETTDAELGEHEGIPPNGVFHITFTGWQEDLTVGTEQLYNGIPTTTDTFAATPEPSSFLALGTGLLLLAAMWRRAVR